MLNHKTFEKKLVPLCQAITVAPVMTYYAEHGADSSLVTAILAMTSGTLPPTLDEKPYEYVKRITIKLLDGIEDVYGIEEINDTESYRDALHATGLILTPELLVYVESLHNYYPVIKEPIQLLEALDIFSTDDTYQPEILKGQNTDLYPLTDAIIAACDTVLITAKGNSNIGNLIYLEDAGYDCLELARDCAGTTAACIVTRKGNFIYG